jgi:hypothetical protein
MNEIKEFYGAWVSPKGKYFPFVEVYGHEDKAKEITGGLMPEFDDMLPESSYLLASGWMRVQFSKIPSFQCNKFTRHQNEWIDSVSDSYIGEAETWEEFIKRSEESYKFSPIYPFGEEKIKTNVILTKQAV